MTHRKENDLLLIDIVVARILQTMLKMLEPDTGVIRFKFQGGNNEGCSVLVGGERLSYDAESDRFTESSDKPEVVVPITTLDGGEKLLPSLYVRARDQMQFNADYLKYVGTYINVPYGGLESCDDIINAFVERLVTIVGQDRFYGTGPYHCGYVIFDRFRDRVLFQLSGNTDDDSVNDVVLTIITDQVITGFTLTNRQELMLELPQDGIVTGIAAALDELAVMYAKLGSIEDNDNV